MKQTMLALAVISMLGVSSASAQSACGQPPVTTWTVQFFEKWEDAVARMVANSAFRNTMSITPVNSAAKSGYLVAFEKTINFTNDCPPQAIETVEVSTPGWHRQIIESPSLAEAFAAALPTGTPVGLMSLPAGYAAGTGTSSRRRTVTHTSVVLPARGLVVVWYQD